MLVFPCKLTFLSSTHALTQGKLRKPLQDNCGHTFPARLFYFPFLCWRKINPNQNRNSSHFFSFQSSDFGTTTSTPTWSLSKKKERKKETLNSHTTPSRTSHLWKGPWLWHSHCLPPPIVSIMYEQTADKSEKFYDATAAFLIALSSWPDSVEVLITAKSQIMNVTQRKHNLFNGKMVKNWTEPPSGLLLQTPALLMTFS